uniref:Cyclic AMP-dependent transcription factor ATF-4 n=1 Tax=Monopterus albus TaxID=43700 RepID=A0A3Q3J016_MONAL|nr:cyclic AMP-dependent transcription factor ATF-4-like [Monopterus albus]
MTMMMTNSQFGLEDMEDLFWASSPMADVMGSAFFHPDLEEKQEGGGTSLEGGTSPASPLTTSSLSSSSSPPPFYSPRSPPAALHGDKAGTESDVLSLPWLGHPGPLRCSQMASDDCKEDAFCDLDWMAERVDLREFDLDSLIGSCSTTEDSTSSPEDLLASLDCPMELDSLPMPSHSTPTPPSLSSASPPPVLPTVCPDLPTITVNGSESCVDEQEPPSPPLCVPEPQEELEIKSETASPEPSSPLVDSPSSPAYTLDLGSEVDVSESEVKPVVAAVIPQVPRLVLSLSPTRIVLVLAPKNEVEVTTSTVTTTSELTHPPTPQRSSRSRPYPEPKCKASPPSPSVKVKALQGAGGDNRATFKAPKDKKVKKMEQNKTAATRYRQKKRAEHDKLSEEHALLERKNMELTEKAESMAREIEYLKELMEEVRLARMKKGVGADP